MYWTEMFGDDYDCEYCGYSYNHADVSYDPVDNEWAGYVSWGCYGGASAYTKSEIVQMLIDYVVFDLAADVYLEQNYTKEEE